jgi:hypothetical protein
VSSDAPFFMKRTTAWAVGVLVLVTPLGSLADESPTTPASPAPGSAAPASADAAAAAAREKELIKQSQDPVSNLGVLPIQPNFYYGQGLYQRTQTVTNIQPVIPIVLNKQWNVISRTIVPIINLPSSVPPSQCNSTIGCPTLTGFGDIQQQTAFTPAKPATVTWGAGPIFQFATASPNLGPVGSHQTAAGVNAVGLIMPGNFVMGALVTQLWSIGGSSPTNPAVNSMLIQPFVNYNFGKGWALSTAPNITANFSATPGQAWTVPLGLGLTKTFVLATTPMQFGVQYYSNIVKPNLAPSTQLKFTLSFLFPVKRRYSGP